MRKIIVAEHISLDGVIQGPGSPKEDPSDDFRLGGWTVPYVDEAIGQALQDLFSEPFELLLGRHTYDIWAAYWPHVRAGNAIADAFNSVPKHVATHRSANLLTWGSGEMVRQLLADGLVDEMWLLIYPVVLGRGKRLFNEDAQASAFTLAHSTTASSGALITRYVRSGEVRTGTFEEVE
jgi:dihydrofolate reductase